MAATCLPEDIIVIILSWLPVKSLIRFSCVSKRFRFIILSDPKFAKSQFKASCEKKTLSRRLLVSTIISTMTSQLESVGLETLSSGDNFSVRRLNYPFQLPPDRCVKLLGSCNGLVFVAHGDTDFHIWNPSTGFLKKLPGPDFTTLKPYVSSRIVNYYGVGYLSSTDDYKVVVACKMHYFSYIKDEVQVAIFSVRAHFWRRIESPPGLLNFCPGTLSNDALHWLKPLKYHEEIKIVAFDLAKEEFRNIGLPHFEEDGNSSTHLGVSDGGCLSVTRYGAIDSIDFWVMREYNVPESWTKLFNLNLSSPTDQWQRLRPILVTESSIIVNEWTTNGYMLIRIDHKGEKVGLQMSKGDWVRMIEYEESLLWID